MKTNRVVTQAVCPECHEPRGFLHAGWCSSLERAPQETPDDKIARLAGDAYLKFADEPLVKACGGVDRASYCAGFDEGYRAALKESQRK